MTRTRAVGAGREQAQQRGHAAAQLGARHHQVDHAVRQHELGRVDVVRQLLLGRLLDHARAGEGDEGAGLGHGHVGPEDIAGEHTADGGVGEDGEIRQAPAFKAV